jgi:hypothetical protein
MAVAPRDAMMSGFLSVVAERVGRRWKIAVARARPVKVPRRARRVVRSVEGAGWGCGRWPRRWARGRGRRCRRGRGMKGLRWWSMSKGPVRGEGVEEGEDELRRVDLEDVELAAVELVAEVVEGAGEELVGSMVRALMASAVVVVKPTSERGRTRKRRERRREERQKTRRIREDKSTKEQEIQDSRKKMTNG